MKNQKKELIQPFKDNSDEQPGKIFEKEGREVVYGMLFLITFNFLNRIQHSQAETPTRCRFGKPLNQRFKVGALFLH